MLESLHAILAMNKYAIKMLSSGIDLTDKDALSTHNHFIGKLALLTAVERCIMGMKPHDKYQHLNFWLM